jgi:hypothetical protein
MIDDHPAMAIVRRHVQTDPKGNEFCLIKARLI